MVEYIKAKLEMN